MADRLEDPKLIGLVILAEGFALKHSGARVEGLEPAREISLVRAAGRSATRNADAFIEFARERLA